jgi:hypothetical protein
MVLAPQLQDTISNGKLMPRRTAWRLLRIANILLAWQLQYQAKQNT